MLSLAVKLGEVAVDKLVVPKPVLAFLPLFAQDIWDEASRSAEAMLSHQG